MLSGSTSSANNLKDCPAGAIIKVDGRWGVLCKGFGYGIMTKGTRVVDFWDGGLEHIDADAIVEERVS